MCITKTQLKVLAIAPKVVSPISAVASIWIVYDVRKRGRRRGYRGNCRVYHRIILMMSLTDIVHDIVLFMSTWPISVGSPSAWGAAGSVATCDVQGFLRQLTALAFVLYNALLSVHFLLVIRYNWSANHFKGIEVWTHGAIWMVCFGTSIAGLCLKLYNNDLALCWIRSAPIGCNGDNCIRGKYAESLVWAFFYVPVWLSISAATFIMINIYLVIRQRERTMIPYMRHIRRSAWHKKSRKLANQAALYVAAFFVAWAAPTVARAVQQVSGSDCGWYHALLLAVVVNPMQGFFNFIVYVSPRCHLLISPSPLCCASRRRVASDSSFHLRCQRWKQGDADKLPSPMVERTERRGESHRERRSEIVGATSERDLMHQNEGPNDGPEPDSIPET